MADAEARVLADDAPGKVGQFALDLRAPFDGDGVLLAGESLLLDLEIMLKTVTGSGQGDAAK